MTARSVLKSSVGVSRMVNNQPVMVTGWTTWETSAFKGTITGDAIEGKVITGVGNSIVSGVRN